jgi:hypothetical protein
MSNKPLISRGKVIEYLQTVCNELHPIVEVSDLYPSEDDVVAYGIYVDDVDYETRETIQLGIQQCGSIYAAIDSFNILFVSYQNDPQREIVEDSIYDLASNAKFFDGYHEVTFTEDSVFGNSKSERVTYTFNLKRLNFND